SPADSHHHLFTHNQFHDYAGSGLGSPLSGGGISDYGIIMYFSTDVKATNNYFYGHHHQCLSFKKIMHNSVAANNIFEGAYYTAIYLGQNEDSKSEGILRCHNLVAEGNVFRPTPEYRLKSPVWVANVTGAIVRNNFMDAPNGYSGQGIGVNKSARNVKIYGNVIIDSSASRSNPGIRIAADCEIYNNTVVGCHSALEFYFKTEGQKIRAVCRNNIFYKNTRPIHTIGKKGDYSASVFERNNWFPDWSGKGATDISSDPNFVGPIKPLKLNPYNPGAGSRGDRSGRPTPKGDIKLSPFVPKFVPDFTRMRAYQLKKTSPCIDKGVKTGLPFVGKSADIGAFEFGEKNIK
ncbi:MAG: right-handed parallel beta-helix repeat-containing protein, partial [Phycisphaerae bacterium]|nr:right-handed parallel beta-helix repeat-containing protein [Phycisphaerae bacterium]